VKVRCKKHWAGANKHSDAFDSGDEGEKKGGRGYCRGVLEGKITKLELEKESWEKMMVFKMASKSQ